MNETKFIQQKQQVSITIFWIDTNVAFTNVLNLETEIWQLDINNDLKKK